MAAPVNANINVLVNTQQAMAQLRALQGQVATLNSSISATSGAAAAQQAALAKGLKDSANASRMWQARIVPMNTATQQFSDALDKGRMSLGQYTRFAASQLPGMSRVFKREFEMMNRVATQNVRQMQTQYVQLGRSATGAAQAMALTPTALNKHASAAAVAAQRQMMMNRMIDLGTTKLLNWGKNTQWAGRQLMVGFSIPLAMVGAVAAKAFKEIDKGSIAFKRVYGDLSTTTAEMERNLEAVKALGNEYTKYGLKLADTIELAADVAATGAKNESLMAATEQTLRLATLGLMEYGEALEATVALQTAFQVSNEDLAGTIDFLNVVENETILTMQDMAAAIPRVAPVVKGLGGDVKDLAVFMTAMREGGVTAEQGANALKSGLGRLINPTKAAREVMSEFGLSIDRIIQTNRGDLMGMMQDFGKALSSLGDFEQQQVLEKVFGKYQYARLGALFKNLANDASQANRTIELTNMSMEDLASISERELSKIEEATSTKFQAAVERLKVSIAPVGEQFMKALMPVIDFVTKIANKFNDLPDSIKNAIAIGVAAIAGIGPIVLMTVGLIANGIANIGKLIQTMRKFFARLKGDASLFNYLTQEEREAATAANALGGATDSLTGKFLGQRRALESLIGMVNNYTKALAGAAAAAPLGFGIGTAAAAARGATAKGTVITGPRTGGTTVTGPGGLRMAKGGVVPGSGNKDTVPAMLTPGESVVTKEATQKYGPMIQAMNDGAIPGFINGVVNAGTKQRSPQSSGAALVFAHGQDPIPLTPQQLATLKQISKSQYVQQATRGQSLSNFGFVTPSRFNTGEMGGKEAARLFTDKKIVDRTMYPMYSAIARQLGNMSPEQAMRDPAIRGDVRRFAAGIARGLYSQTGKIGNEQFYAAADKALRETRMSESSRAGIMASKKATTVALYGGDIRTKGERVGLGRRVQERVFGQQGQVSYRSQKGLLGKAAMVVAGPFKAAIGKSLGNNSPSVHAQSMVTQYVDGLEIGAQKNVADSAKAGKVVGNSFAASVKQSILTGKTSPGLIPGAAKKEYLAAQSASRREAYNIKEMQRVGMTDAQIIRQLDRLKASKEKQAQAQERQAKAAAANAKLAQVNANLAQQSNKQMVVEEQARRRGLRTRVSEYFATPVGDGTQTRGQAMRARAGSATGGAVMGLMGLSMAASFAGGEVGEMAQKVMPVTMGLMGLQMILPMLTNPIGLAIIAVAALTATIVKTRMDLDKLARSSAEAGANLGGIANGMKVLEEATGFAVPRPEDRLFRFTEEDRQAMSEFGSYFESESGSKFIQELKEATSEERYQRVSTLLAQGIASGMDEEKAKAFGNAIAEATGDYLLSSSIARDFANQAFGRGSERLIDIERERFATFAPEVSAPTTVIAGRTVESNLASQLAKEMFAGEAIKVPLLDIEAPGWLRAFIKGPAWIAQSVFSRVEGAKIEKAAQGLGFVVQSIDNLYNAEAVLEQERISGAITIDEYRSRLAELEEVQQQQTDYLGQILSIGADAGAMAQALGSQLSFKGFSEEQVKNITEEFNVNKLAQKIFQQDFGVLDEAQQDYIEEVFARTLSGLTPENAAQRLDDIERIYAQIAEDVVKGIYGSLEEGAQVAGFSGAIKSALGVKTGFTSALTGETVWDSDILAKNLEDANDKLMEFGSDSEEVLTTLLKFEDVKFASSLLENEDDILRVAKAIKELGEYENIDIEFVLRSNIDPADVARNIEYINRIKLDPQIFGPLGFEADKIVDVFMKMGIEVDDIPDKLRDGVAAIDKFGKNAVDKLGNIKPKIIPQIIANVFGKSAQNPGQIAQALDSAFPNSLSPIDLAIILTLAGDPNAISLLSNPQAIAAAKAGQKTFTTTKRVGGETFRREINLAPLAPLVLTGQGVGGPGRGAAENDGGGGGGGGTESWLEGLRKEINANIKLFVGNVKKDIPSIFSQVADLNLPVMLLKQIGAGPDGLARAKELLDLSAKQIKELIKNYSKSIIGEFLAGQKIDLLGSQQVSQARTKLEGMNVAGRKIESSIIDQILEDEKARLVVLYGTNAEIRRMVKNYREIAYNLDPIESELERLRAEFKEPIMIEVELREAKFQKAFNDLDRLYRPQVEAAENNIRALEKQKRAVEDQIDALQRLQQQDQMRIRGLQRQITMLERQKSAIQKQIDELEYQNELDQRRINALNREDALRKRVADSLNRELEIMSRQEEKIRQAYQRRIDALDKVAALNDYIMSQQRGQLGLAQAISTGDIYAATAAAQGMRQESAQFAQQQLRTGLETGAESAVAGLRTSEGLTREQAEARILEIQEQSYQTSLLVRDIEDRIYERNLQMLPLKDQIREIDKQIEEIRAQILAIEDIMYDRETQILEIEQNRLNPINDALKAEQAKLDELNEEIQLKKDLVEVDGLTYKQHQEALTAFEDQWRLAEANAKVMQQQGVQIAGIVAALNKATKAANEFWKAYRGNKGDSDIKPEPIPELNVGELPKRMSVGGEVIDTYASKANDIVKGAMERYQALQQSRDDYNTFVMEGGTAVLTKEAVEKGYGGIPASIFAEKSPNNKFAGGLMKKYAVGGNILGDGGMDSIPAMLTPGEFVIRRAMVNKYGTPFFEAINQGSLSIPRYSLPGNEDYNLGTNVNNMMTSINAPVYNTYDMKFAINGSNQSADEIANQVMFKMRQLQNQSLRGNRGY